MKKFLSYLIVIFLFGASSMNVEANQTTIYGQDISGNLTPLTGSLCVLPTQGLRLRADVVDQLGRRYGLPVNFFIWRLTRESGRWVQWDARYSRGYGPWEAGEEPHSVYLWLDEDLGANGLIQAATQNAANATLKIVDPTHPDNRANCTWGPQEIYMDGDDGFPTEPPNPPILEMCYNNCDVDKYCLDGCPFGATCRFYPAQPNPYWHVTACR